MAVLFFSVESAIGDVARRVFAALHLTNATEGDSLHALQGIYFQASAFGHRLRLEGNCYEYEDKYTYMLSIRKDFLAAGKSNDEAEEFLADAVALLLKLNLGIEVARERDGKLVVL